MTLANGRPGQILKYDPSKITISWGGVKIEGFCTGIVELRRSPWRVLLDLRLAELVYRDACEAGTRTPDEVTRLLAICNDLRDELALDVSARSPSRTKRNPRFRFVQAHRGGLHRWEL